MSLFHPANEFMGLKSDYFMYIAMFSDTYAPQVNGVVNDDKDARRESPEKGAQRLYLQGRSPEGHESGKCVSGTSLRFPWEKQHRIGLPTNTGIDSDHI
jgi:1,2-diacylglycerol 3-alpha-glucosyltransferase